MLDKLIRVRANSDTDVNDRYKYIPQRMSFFGKIIPECLAIYGDKIPIEYIKSCKDIWFDRSTLSVRYKRFIRLSFMDEFVHTEYFDTQEDFDKRFIEIEYEICSRTMMTIELK